MRNRKELVIIVMRNVTQKGEYEKLIILKPRSQAKIDILRQLPARIPGLLLEMRHARGPVRFPGAVGGGGQSKEDRSKGGAASETPPPIHGQGVFALRDVRKGVQMGPYEGNMTRVDTTNGYAWKLRDGKLIDAGDETNSNWMRYVNCARNANEQNAVAFQYRGELYYRTCKEVRKGEELLVFYGQSFARILGIDTKNFFRPVEEDANIDFYPCKYCGMGLSATEYRDSHERFCRFRPNRKAVYAVGDIFRCKYCCITLTTREYLEKHEKYCSKKTKVVQKKSGPKTEEEIEKELKCDKCTYSSKWRHALKQHIMVIHDKENVVIYRCHECQFQTHYKSNFSGHIQTHKKK
ncbi:hypothetical protein NQ317_004609 [Molorchus minor]|uniref:SET domain-containing protein n=1 Tax=Molorchus minor TaxID=1323400 RepID=A0ABQ9J4G3_9CUCU|nr:hypothetical protein NQ317_004609 [Molorchus minor]